MPPQRTVPPAKAVKTERTHEENQERAYIAASRRSDRSLEARVESARRASEIHKRRTGRSLRVTEQDVVNEEMYEEEDDDLPLQYRRLTAHLQTGSADFNRRLAAYLTNHVAMRSALDQAITNSYAHEYPNAPQFAHNQQNLYPSPMMPQQMQQQQQQPPLPQGYRQSPYPTPTASAYRPSPHGRSASIATPQEVPGYSSNGVKASPILTSTQAEQRRMSMPAQASSPVAAKTPQLLQAPQVKHTPTTTPAHTPYNIKQESQQANALQPMLMQSPFDFNNYSDFGPFAAPLPSESQMLLGPSLDPYDPFSSMLMSGSEQMSQPFYNFNPTASMSKPRNFHPSYDGMSATLAPSALDMSPCNQATPSSAGTDPLVTPTFHYNFDGAMPDFIKPANITRSNSTHGSGGATTPGIDGEWHNYIDGNSWEESVA
ncbi:MAG: hypothetical protein M1827_000283 [Pycnora praestabilis]|nr:MAG: hypothetical protein M1827_000283 [Pycnora praestabilis]